MELSMARIARRSASPSKGAIKIAPPPRWIEPQLCKLADKAPGGSDWVHEIKFDGYRMAARIDRGGVQLLTRSGLGWTEKYRETAAVSL
jgi:ATP-dependent DNA ligase